MCDDRFWQILNEVRDLANFYPLKRAVAKVAQHYGIDHRLLMERYKEAFNA